MSNSTTGAGTADAELTEITELYERLGIANAAQRARFNAFAEKPQPTLAMTVVVSTTSQPFRA